MDDDAIFKALNDPTRRALLDALRQTDGQTLTDLEAGLSMTRFGVMKHLALLEAAGLVTTVRRGRFKHHYLNAVPLQEVIDRWIEPLLARPAARAVLDLKSRLEGDAAVTPAPDVAHRTIIRCTAQRLWDALLDPDLSALYYFDSVVSGDPSPGGTLEWKKPDGTPMITAQVIDADPPRRLNLTFEPHFMGDGATASRHVFAIRDLGAAAMLTIEHYDLPAPQRPAVGAGWVLIADRLKTLIETGEPLHVPLDALLTA